MIRKVMFYSLLLPYLLLGTIGGIFLMAMYRTSVDSNRRSVIDTNISILKQIDKDMKYILEDAEHLLSEINNMDTVMRLRELEPDRSGKDNYHIAMAQNQLKEVRRFNTYVDDILFYFDKPKLYVTTRSIRTPRLLLEEYRMESRVSEEEWEKFLTASYEKRQIVTIGDEMFLVMTNTYGAEEGTVSLFIKFDTEKLRGMIDGYHSLNEGELYIFNSAGEEMLSNQEVSGADLNAYAGSPDSTRHVIIRQDGEALGTKYLWFTDRRTIDQKSDYILQSFCLVGILFSLLLLAGIWSVRANYRQISRILERLKGKRFVSEGQKKYSETYFIHAALNTMEGQLEAQDRVLLEDAVKKGIYGLLEEGDEPWRFLLQKAPFLFSGQTVLAVWGQAAKGETAVKERKLNLFILNNVLSEMLGETLWIGILPFAEWSLVLMNGAWKKEPELNWLLEQLEGARRFLTDYLGDSYSVGVSRPSQGVEGLKVAYREAVSAFEEGNAVCSRSVVYVETLTQFSHTYMFPPVIRRKLLNCLRAGDGEEAKRILDELYETNFVKIRLSAESGKILLLEIMGVCMEAAEGMEPPCGLDRSQVIEEENSPQMMFDKIRAAASRIAENGGGRSLEGSVHVAEMAVYIQQNYSNLDLNVNGIAAHFSMNPSYLSRVFKEKTGKNLLDYINQYRTEEAKRLLIDTDDSIAHIAVAAGFGNTAAIMRAFKKNEGITPGQYRNAYHEKEK